MTNIIPNGQTSRHGIVVIGSGFAALSAVREIRKQDSKVPVTVISPMAELHYLPGIIWIPSGVRTREQLIVPLGNFFKRMRVRHLTADVTGLSADGRTVITTAGDVTNEALIIASGGRFLKKLPGIEHVITPCEGISAAEKIRDRLKNMREGTIAIGFGANPNEPTAVRGGPMFEFLFGIDELLRQEGRRERFRIVFFNPSKEPGSRLGNKTVRHLLAEMERRQIRTHLGHKILGFESDMVVTEGGGFNADLILFMPGMTGNAWFDNTALPRSAGGLLKADKYCRAEGMTHVYVAGDSGSFPGPDWTPKQAHMADLQARAAARNAIDELNGKSASNTFAVELMCIIDGLRKGTFVWRTEKFNVMLPPMRLMHWAKRMFEVIYLAKYR